MSDISIVTAFYDIGRGNWSPENGHPSYLHRTVDTYIERFGYMSRLCNDITVFTSSDLADKIVNACDSDCRVKIFTFDAINYFSKTRDIINSVQKSESYRKIIHPSQIINPEYWNPDYVLVTNLKPYFVNKAINMNSSINDMVAWVDFGYCRSEKQIPSSRIWKYDYNSELIHLLSYKNWNNVPIEQVVASNDVYIPGAIIAATKKLWPKMLELMQSSFNKLLEKNMVDDDQGLLLYSYMQNKNLFQLHSVPDHQRGHDPLVFFNSYNTTVK
jgi:protein YibB